MYTLKGVQVNRWVQGEGVHCTGCTGKYMGSGEGVHFTGCTVQVNIWVHVDNSTLYYK